MTQCPRALSTALRDPRLSGGTDSNVALPMRSEENLQRRREVGSITVRQNCGVRVDVNVCVG